ncbi:MAG: DUF2892 domain-containing protein [Kamptonema sp. SIO4C4]|nr:DUF2892 domain-containing protein [Kamptonema sp. SIO4C4]
MFTNVGTFDRLFRLLIAGALLYVGLSVYAGTTLGIVLNVAAAILALTAVFGFCGLYRLLGINTRNTETNSQS